MPTPRNPMTYLIVGTAIGVVLGVVVGIVIGHATTAPSTVRTVARTQTVRVPGPVTTVQSPAAGKRGTQTTATSTVDTTATDTTATFGTDTTSTFTPPVPTTTAETTPAIDTTGGSTAPNDIPPADVYNPPHDFCSTHVCVPSFSRGVGFAVQCADGIWTMQGGQPGVCRDDGGLP